MKQLNIDKLNEHLFESIEMLKNSKDPKASECEKMDAATAREIANISKIIIEGYKTKVQAANLLRNAENPNATLAFLNSAGFVSGTKGLLPEAGID